MYSTTRRGDWYGMLSTRKGDTVVIRDAGLPKAGQGKVYLYNTEREAFIEYVEEIVKTRLRDLKGEEKARAQAEYEGQWQAAREVFMAAHGGDPVPPVDTRRGDLEALLPDASEEPVAEGEEFEDL